MTLNLTPTPEQCEHFQSKYKPLTAEDYKLIQQFRPELGDYWKGDRVDTGAEIAYRKRTLKHWSTHQFDLQEGFEIVQVKNELAAWIIYKIDRTYRMGKMTEEKMRAACKNLLKSLPGLHEICEALIEQAETEDTSDLVSPPVQYTVKHQMEIGHAGPILPADHPDAGPPDPSGAKFFLGRTPDGIDYDP